MGVIVSAGSAIERLEHQTARPRIKNHPLRLARRPHKYHADVLQEIPHDVDVGDGEPGGPGDFGVFLIVHLLFCPIQCNFKAILSP